MKNKEITDDEFFRYLIERGSLANERGDWLAVAWYLSLTLIGFPSVFLSALWELVTEGWSNEN